MKLILDAMGGDYAPLQPVLGAFDAANAYGIDIILVGKKAEIDDIIAENNLTAGNGSITVVNAEQSISMEDEPLCVMKEKKNSSLAIALRMLHDGQGDALISAGSTGALHAGSTLIVRRIKGIRKSAIATVLPFDKPLLLLDSGANIDLTPDVLVQFAHMGNIYMKNIFGIENPKIGLLNIGTESTKGLDLQRKAYMLLSEDKTVDFVGNIEARDIPYGLCDVLVTDGFSGNIVLKYSEGLSKFIMRKVSGVCKKNALTKLSATLLKKDLYAMKKSFDSSEYGGAPLLGLTKPVIKAHGNSDAKAIKHALRQAMFCVNKNLPLEISKSVADINTEAVDERN